MAEIGKKKSFQRALVGLRDRILVGDLVQGDRVSEVALSEELGISRTPLREAMRELVDQGLLERLPNGGCRVSSLTKRDVQDFIALRGLMEGAVFRIAAERGITKEKRESCESVISEIDIALGESVAHIDFDRYVALNAKLHQKLAALCDSTVMVAELARISKRPMAGPSAFLSDQALAPKTLQSLYVAQYQHKAILNAIANREGARAESLAREHARLAHRNLEFFLASERPTIKGVSGLTFVQIDADTGVGMKP
ncbi:GntR family transcriptional regulator [Yoonia sp.]|uniref:GntR family transcriptional regulator n=1 Tax=Yoonia sp. TaxID=2212373 RepID=UPI0019DF2445|nr:GntR family transcriptional regulator [Yoonia sp.]MBE0412817.1 GntR family transcriptional regulator [Yoonia sp.]